MSWLIGAATTLRRCPSCSPWIEAGKKDRSRGSLHSLLHRLQHRTAAIAYVGSVPGSML